MMNGTAPLWEALVAYARRGVIPFHTPGHKLHPGPFQRIAEMMGPGFFAMDPSDEVEHPSSGHQFETVLLQAEALAAQMFGSSGTLFLTNGTTGGLQIALLPQTGRVLVPRFSHQSVYSSLALSGAEPVFLPAVLDPRSLLPLQPTLQVWRDALEKYRPECAVVTHPTYYGCCVDLVGLTQLCAAFDCELIVDEAHGAHFGFHEELPITAMKAGASIAVQSTHKTLGAWTGSSMLHAKTNQVWQRCRWAQSYLQTTSPSLPALAVLDETRRVWQEYGPELIGHVLMLSKELRQHLALIEGVELLPKAEDPTKVMFSLGTVGLSGQEVERLLRKEHNIQVEMSEHRWAAAHITVGDTSENIEALAKAIRSLAVQGSRRTKTENKVLLGQSPLPWPQSLPETATRSMLAASRQTKQLIPLSLCLGRISAAFVTPYPPGVPLLVPGEIWNEDLMEYTQLALRQGWYVRGTEEEMVWVVEDSNSFCRTMKQRS